MKVINVAVNKVAPIIVAPALSMALFAAPANAQEVDNRANIYGGVSRFILDSDHNQENGNGWLIGGELPVSERWSATLEHWATESDVNNSTDESDISYNRLGANYHLNKIDFWQPYLAVGLGELDIDPDVAPDIVDTALDFGIGVKAFLNENFILRGDAKALIGEDSTRDFLVGLSVGYVFGSNTPAPRPAPAAAPVDSDGDGVFDEQDSCRNTPSGVSVDSRGCELDSDKDGVVDSRDQCPATATNLAVDNRGCPVTEVVEFRQTLLVNFDTNQAIVKEQYNNEISDFADFMETYDNSTAIIEGHTDSDGAENYNQTLSQRRAVAVMNRLIELGIESERLSAIGYGESRPVGPNSTTAGKARNRRIEAVVTAEEQRQRDR